MFLRSLSSRLLVLTIFFVMLGEVLIFVPSVARFRMTYFEDHIAAAHIATLALIASPTGRLDQALTDELLAEVGAHSITLHRPNGMVQMLDGPEVPQADVTFTLGSGNVPIWIQRSFETLFSSGNRIMRVIGMSPFEPDTRVEVLLDEAPLREEMWKFGGRIFQLSIILSVMAAALVYLSLQWLLVRPMRRMTANMVAFRADPENPARIMAASDRMDEIGTAERELAAMQLDLATLLQQKNHLAALGLAVSKINHDLRNLLSSAQLFSERLAKISDPHVQRFAPKLMLSLERAIAFCQSTLSYGRVQEPPPDRRLISLELLADDVRETLGLDSSAPVRWVTAIERGLTVDADPDQLFRILLNLARNAMQALETRDAKDPGRDQIRVTGRREGAVVVIEVSDTGPGLSEKARAHLFEAFQGSTRTGSVGLGLAIVAELVRAHGGEIRLVEGTIGATFRLSIPDRAVDLDTRRGERARA